MNPTLRALNGFGLGARVGERQRIGDPRDWLRAQIRGNTPPVINPPSEATPQAISDALRTFRMVGAAQNEEQRRDARRQARRRLVEIAAAESRAALTERATTESPVRRTPGRVLVQPLVRVGRREGARGAARGQLRARSDPPARARTIRGHGAGVRAASRDARLPRQLPIDRPELARCAGRRARPRPAARSQRELRARAARAAHARRQRRLHAAGRAGAREDSDGLDGRWTCARPARQSMRPAQPAAGVQGELADRCRTRSASRSRSCCTSRERRPCWAWIQRRRAKTRASGRSARCAAIRRPRVSSRRSSSRTSSATSRRPPAVDRDRARVPRHATAICAPYPRALIDLPEAWTRWRTEVPHAAGLARGRAARVQRRRP